MNHFKRQAFYREFPLLRAIERDPQACEQIVVRRITIDLLQRRPAQYQATGPEVDIHEGDEVSLWAATGQALGRVRAEREVHHRAADRHTTPGETVLEAIARLGLAGRVHYIVWVAYGYRIVRHQSDPAWRVTIYKPARGLRLADLVAQAEAKAQAIVAAEVDF